MNFDETLAFVAQDMISGLENQQFFDVPSYPEMGTLQTGMALVYHFRPPIAFECCCPPWITCYCQMPEKPRDVAPWEN